MRIRTEKEMCRLLEQSLYDPKALKELCRAMREFDWSPYQTFRNALADQIETLTRD